ncbi:SUF system Fe-S cluster assembly regulator [Alkalilimnicola ehrlichii]|uniref:SUF system Fe-S cluster assembly regulator n=1 Tax=Alkalilimnicola ehrlichii TaxID=351052 RepID=A0A3E0X2H0_9GAMM|nr:SUF system Fe-S cluster assembly regulator [Alkalilimnicola ehrlichii]RFA31062.1 SUF system Fe-S cluster assembly regulator [Alkalilimnicola ehrlichii]RFA39019.1 SUF system Fe-S cluster assembly regulator [Alkalilimnicola ehrlichii]
MIRINRETDYGVVILSLMAMDTDRRYNAAWLAEQRGLPQPVVSKILKHLAKAGLLVSYRGAKGGYGLARSAQEITVADIVAAMEGPIALTDCVEGGDASCQYSGQCVVSTNWNRINQVVQRALEGITLADMTKPLPDPGANVRPSEVFVSLSNFD